jgi:Protein of unknown function (DUF3106)
MEKRPCENDGETRMQKQVRKVSAWWASPVLGLVFCVLSEAFSWSYPYAGSDVPSPREEEDNVFIHQDKSIRTCDESRPVIGRRMDRQGEMERWESLPPEERLEMHRRMDRWKELSPQDQQLFRKRYRQWQELAPEERQRMKENLQDWDALSPQQKDQIRKKFQTP